LLGSVLPRIVLEEAFSQTVTRDAQAIISLSVIGSALLVTVVWKPLRVLRPFLVVFLVLVVGHWFVHGRFASLRCCPSTAPGCATRPSTSTCWPSSR
jgi:hypothetical protein